MASAWESYCMRAWLWKSGAPLVVALVSATLTLFAWWQAETGQRDLAAVAFQRDASAIEAMIRERTELYESVLRAGQGLMQGSTTVTPEEWDTFGHAMALQDRFPGLTAVVYFDYATDDALDRILSHHAVLTGEHIQLRLPPGFTRRSEHFIATLVTPSMMRGELLGLDLAGETVRRVTAERARDSGGLAVSPVLDLVAYPAGRTVIALAPVYEVSAPVETVAQRRAALRGLVAVGYDVGLMLDGIMKGVAPDLQVKVFDRAESEAGISPEGRLIYAAGGGGAEGAASFVYRGTIDLGQRQWLLEVSAGQAASARLSGEVSSPLFLVVGLVASFLLGVLIWLLVDRRQQAQQLADEMTAALQQSEERYRQLFMANRAVELLIDPENGCVVDANEAAARFYGWSLETLRGMSIAEINTLTPEQIRAEMTLAALERRDHFLFQHRLANGDVRDVEVHSGPVAQGGKQLLYSIIHDVTERRRAENALALSETRFRALFEDSPLAIQVLDPGGRTVRVNAAWRRLWQGELEGAPSEDAQLRRAGIVAHLRRAFAGDVVEIPAFRYRLGTVSEDDGGWRWVRGYAYPIRDPDGDGHQLIVVWENVTEKRSQEERLRETLSELERSNADLEQFAYVASHDLQEPLRMISSYIGLLRRRYGDEMKDEALEFMAYAVDGAHRMQDIINDLLTYSRVGRKGQPFVACSLRGALDTALDALTVGLRDSGAEVTVEGDLPVISGDALELSRLFQNLIGNALKYRRPETSPVIRIACEQEDAFWRVSVTDNGIGVAQEFHERIFQIFQRLHTRDEYGGTGVGLAICKKIVERHGGQIGISSQEGEGACFWFTLPVLEAADVAGKDEAADHSAVQPA